MTTTDRLIPTVDPSFWAAYNQNPQDMVLVGAMADHCRDQGDEETAEFWDYIRLANLYPQNRQNGDTADWGYWEADPHIPHELWVKMPLRHYYDLPVNSIWRVYIGWQLLTDTHRRQLMAEVRPPEQGQGSINILTPNQKAL